jgi:hypothetical protein
LEIKNEISASSAEGIKDILDVLLDDKNSSGLSNSVGISYGGRSDLNIFGLGLEKETVKFRNYAKQLGSKATMDVLVKLKQQGGTLGALSDQERIMLQDAAIGNLGYDTDANDGTFVSDEEDFVENIEILSMAQMKIYLSAKDTEGFKFNNLKVVEYDTEIGRKEDGSVITGFDFISEMYEDAKIDVLNQKQFSTYNIKGQKMSEQQQDKNVDFNAIINIESQGSYTALNKSSGAYGKYQFIPSTLKVYADKLGMSIEEAKTPAGQEAMFKSFTDDNKKGLEKMNIPINTLSVYMAHQQGLEGVRQIVSGSISKTIRRNLLSNLPSFYKNKSDEEIING